MTTRSNIWRQSRLDFNKKTLDRKEVELHSVGKEITRLREENIEITDKYNEAQDNHNSTHSSTAFSYISFSNIYDKNIRLYTSLLNRKNHEGRYDILLV